MLSVIQRIAERKIEQAMQDGSMPDLSHWRNKPLPSDDMANVPADLRMAYRLLKNAGYLPEELSLRKEIARTEDLLAACTDERQRYQQLKKLSLLRTRLEIRTGRSIQIDDESPYFERVVDRLVPPKD